MNGLSNNIFLLYSELDFSRLHQKQFDKMESIDEYIKRKQFNSAKKVGEQQKLQEKASSSKVFSNKILSSN